MGIATVSVFADSGRASAARLELAINVAVQQSASITLIWVELPNASAREQPASSSYARGPGMNDIARRHDTALGIARAETLARLERAFHEHGLQSEIRELPFESTTEDALVFGHYSDLVVIAQPTDDHPEAKPYGWSIQEVVREVHVPVITVPAGFTRSFLGQRILIAWNASREAHRAVADAMPLLQKASDVRLLMVNPTTGSRTHGEEPGADIARHLGKHRVRVQVDRVDGQGETPSKTILRFAKHIDADLIVVGAYSRSRTSELIFGSNTREILRASEIPLLLSR